MNFCISDVLMNKKNRKKHAQKYFIKTCQFIMYIYICNNINKMNLYSISDLEEYSGITAHAIRVWDQRYNALKAIPYLFGQVFYGQRIRYLSGLNILYPI